MMTTYYFSVNLFLDFLCVNDFAPEEKGANQLLSSSGYLSFWEDIQKKVNDISFIGSDKKPRSVQINLISPINVLLSLLVLFPTPLDKSVLKGYSGPAPVSYNPRTLEIH
jgi:hypothetical protein